MNYQWDTDQLTFWSAIITTIYSAGAMVGALSGGYFVKYGKWNMIMVCNICALVGYSFCLVASLWAVLIGRFFLGLSIGGYCVFCPKFVNEITPLEFRGPVGDKLEYILKFGIRLTTCSSSSRK